MLHYKKLFRTIVNLDDKHEKHTLKNKNYVLLKGTSKNTSFPSTDLCESAKMIAY